VTARRASTESRYGTPSRPRLLDRSCPRCGGLVRMGKTSEVDWTHADGGEVVLVGEGGGTWHRADWAGRCGGCLHELHDLAHDALPPPYYRDQAEGIWAWNREHLEHLRRVFADEADADSPYAFFDSHLPKGWLRRRDRTRRILDRLAAD